MRYANSPAATHTNSCLVEPFPSFSENSQVRGEREPMETIRHGSLRDRGSLGANVLPSRLKSMSMSQSPSRLDPPALDVLAAEKWPQQLSADFGSAATQPIARRRVDDERLVQPGLDAIAAARHKPRRASCALRRSCRVAWRAARPRIARSPRPTAPVASPGRVH